MASSCVVPVVRLENVRNHPAADRLDICDVLGYQMCVPRGAYKSGDIGIYVPADCLVPQEWAKKWGVSAYLKGPEKNRVGRVRLRGEPSFGLIVDMKWLTVPANVGDNVAQAFGIEKYTPPIRTTAGDAEGYDERIDPYVLRYTDIQNGKLLTDIFKDGEEVIATEKAHGTNCKIGLIVNIDTFAGSMSYRRKRPTYPDGSPCGWHDPQMAANTYWYPWTLESVRNLISHFANLGGVKSIILYGEVYGGSVQSLDYGIQKGKGVGFVAFDLCIDGKYLDWDEFKALCDRYEVPTVPVLYRGPYSLSKMKEVADGNTVIGGGKHIREGIVVKPVTERTDPKIGRVCLKYISTEYSLSKHMDADTTDV